MTQETYDLAAVQRADAGSRAPRVVWEAAPTASDRAREGAVTLGVCAASVALVAISLIAVLCLAGAVLVAGSLLHEAVHPVITAGAFQ